jgi:hypothetical protein
MSKKHAMIGFGKIETRPCGQKLLRGEAGPSLLRAYEPTVALPAASTIPLFYERVYMWVVLSSCPEP